jgi:hypothetical protein
VRLESPPTPQDEDRARLKWALLRLALLSGAAMAYTFDSPLYGVSYYHEYMPGERLEKDVELMQKAGVTVVRLGESTSCRKLRNRWPTTITSSSAAFRG